jgi:enterobacterial common antigen flippase
LTKPISQIAHILRASAIVGTGSLVLILTGIVKNKVFAVILGPGGIGLFGLLQSTLSTAATISGLGLSTSGVREIAETQSTEEGSTLGLTRSALWITSSILGFLGAFILVLLREPIASLVLGNRRFSLAIALLGIGVWATALYGSYTAFLNGLQRLGDLARVNIIGAVLGMAFAVASVWLWEMDGVIVAVIAAPLASLVAAWLFARRVKTDKVKFSVRALTEPSVKLLNLGFVFMLTALMVVGTQLGIRVIVTRELGIEATGHFQAAWNLSTLYLGFVLGAMGTDYFPRLTGVAKDRQASNKMMNEQVEVALMLSGPVILAMLTLTPWLIALFYSEAFVETTAVLRWQILGDIFKVASWSLAFLLLAQARKVIYFVTDLAANVVYIGSVWIGLHLWGLEATGIGFLICYIFYFLLIWILVRRLNGFLWSKNSIKLLAVLTLCSAFVFHLRASDSDLLLPIGLLLTLGAGAYSFWRISSSFRPHVLKTPDDLK